ncbi:MAG: lmo0937 family membrane protein [Terriglobales bacterium]
MLWTVFVLLLVLWALGWGFHVAGSTLHLLLVLALLVAVIQLALGRRSPI